MLRSGFASTSWRQLYACALMTTSMLVFCGDVAVAQQDISPGKVRDYIARRAGGIKNLAVPATDAEIPVPPPTDGNTAYRYQTTEAKRYLGKLLFHDPVRTAMIDPAYGAVLATAQQGSCGSCHLGEVASKGGQQISLNLGGEGRGYTDATGAFIARRRPRTDLLPQIRDVQLFPGDALVDNLPTLIDIDVLPPCPSSTLDETTPARAHKVPPVCEILATGRLDPLDSVARQSPSLIGNAFNNRLLLGGFAGQPNTTPGGFNPNNDPAQENLTLLLMDAHRILTDVPPLPGEAPGFNGGSAATSEDTCLCGIVPGRFPAGSRQGRGRERPHFAGQRRYRLPRDGYVPTHRSHPQHAL